MRRRDWAGTVLVACLIAAAGLLRNHTLLLVLLLVVATASVVVILWDVWRERMRPKMPPSEGIEPPPGPPAMFHVGHLGEGHFSRSSGHILRAGHVDKLHSDENRGPTTQTTEGEPREPTGREQWRSILARWSRGRFPRPGR